MAPDHRSRAALAAAAVGLLALGACSSDETVTEPAAAEVVAPDGAPAPGPASAAAALEAGATVIDVRTPEEYDEGHVEGAQLLDVQAPGFDDRIAELDPGVTYVVYCRSGNRSAQAAVRMVDAGLTVLDGGSLDDMLGAGWPAA